MYNNITEKDWNNGYGRMIKPSLDNFIDKQMPTDDIHIINFSDNINTGEDLCSFLSSLTYYDSNNNKPIDEPSQIEEHLEGRYYCKITPELMLEIIKAIRKISRGY